MEPTRLLAVIEVPHENRVRCTADGCGRSVYKRVHIIRQDGALHIYGSACFARKFRGHDVKKSQPQLTSPTGRALSAEERQLLISNTERLIEIFEAEHAEELEQSMARSKLASASTHTRRAREPFRHKAPEFSEAERASAEPEARRLLNARFDGIDFDLPGNNGVLQSEIDRILRERMA